MVEYCDTCDRTFPHVNALIQHYRNSTYHRADYCIPCNKLFGSPHSKTQHDRSSEHYRRIYDYECGQCHAFFCDHLDQLDEHKKSEHFWCKTHDRFFNSASNYNAHMNSKAHLVANIPCPHCPNRFTTHSALTLHWESGTCAGGITRHTVDRYMHTQDRNHLVTTRLLTSGPGSSSGELEADIWATRDTWNGREFVCPWDCGRGYPVLGQLNGHITLVHAPKRTERPYHCPKCSRKFAFLSGLVQHVESRSCGVYDTLEVKRFFGSARMLAY